MIYMQTADEGISPHAQSEHSSSDVKGQSRDFGKLLVEFMRDLLTTFPELKDDRPVLVAS